LWPHHGPAASEARPGLGARRTWCAGGFLGTVLGLRPTLWIAAVGEMAGFAVLLLAPLPRFRLPVS
jgi:hypothetical protein